MSGEEKLLRLQEILTLFHQCPVSPGPILSQFNSLEVRLRFATDGVKVGVGQVAGMMLWSLRCMKVVVMCCVIDT